MQTRTNIPMALLLRRPGTTESVLAKNKSTNGAELTYAGKTSRQRTQGRRLQAVMQKCRSSLGACSHHEAASTE